MGGMWGTRHFEKMATSLQATPGFPEDSLPEDVVNNIWAVAQDPNSFWDGNPDRLQHAKLWAKGWWEIQIGCLCCGHRTPVIFLLCSLDGMSGADKLKHVLKHLFA
jgi:hypothetical protein